MAPMEVTTPPSPSRSLPVAVAVDRAAERLQPQSPPRSRSASASTANPPSASPPRKPLASACGTCSPSFATTAATAAAATTATTVFANTAVAGGKKRVRWSTITIHEFGVGVGGSAVPSKGGPAIGLADAAPEFTWTTRVGEMAERSEGLHRFSAEERVRLLQSAGESDGMILRFSRETNIILASRRRALADAAAEREEEKKSKMMKKKKLAAEQGEAATAAKKRKAELHDARPCAAFLGRPRMIPASYV